MRNSNVFLICLTALISGCQTQHGGSANLLGAVEVRGEQVTGQWPAELPRTIYLKRAVIGFGRGATNMEVQVSVSNLASAQPREPFIVFGTVKDPKKIPGAVVTMNPYVAAPRFVMEKNATQKDMRKTAEQIVNEIVKNAQQFKKQATAVKAAE